MSDNLELVTQARKLEGEMSALKEKVGGEERRGREGEEKREECSKRRRKVKKRFLVLGMIFEIMTPIGHGPCNSRGLCVYIHIYMYRHRSPFTLDHKPSTGAGVQGRGEDRGPNPDATRHIEGAGGGEGAGEGNG